MADNCPTAKATARHFEKVVRASRENYFSDQQIAALPEEMKHVIAGNCDNHSRSSIATEFFRLSGPALEDVLGEAAEQFSAVERAQKETASRRNSSKGKQNKAATRTVQRAAQAGGGSTGTDTTAEQEAATVVAGTIWGMETRGRRKTRRGGCDADFPASAPQKKHQHPKKSPKMPSPERPRT